MTITGDKNQIVRRKAILEMLEDESPLKVGTLVERFNVSAVTIRKDLDALEKLSLVSRVFGGVERVTVVKSAPNYDARKKLYKEEKIRIAKAATALLHEGESLIIDGGSTGAYLCEEIKKMNNLIVVTNAVQLAVELLPCKSITIFILGGRLDRDMQITLGDNVVEQLSKYKVDWLFMGMDGIDVLAGATSYNHLEEAIMRQMIMQAEKKVLIVDDSKIGRVAFAHISKITDFNIIITNYSEKHNQHYKELRNAGLEIIFA